MNEECLAKPSGLLRRVGAMIYDSLLVIALLFLTTIPFVALRGGESVEPADFTYQVSLVLVVYLFFIGFWTQKGRTLGMQSWNLRVEDAYGRRPTVPQASLRFLVAIVSLAAFGLGFLWQLVDRDKMTWHDRASDTRLMHRPKRKPQKN